MSVHVFFLAFQVTHFLADLDIHIHAINKEYVLDNSPSLLSVIRECNVTLRWLLLHRMVKLYLVSSSCNNCFAFISNHYHNEIVNLAKQQTRVMLVFLLFYILTYCFIDQ